MRTFALILGLLAATAGAHAAGLVKVSFGPLEQFSDVGASRTDRERNVRTMAGHFTSLAPRLADGQTLDVEVLDVNLAGELWLLRRGGDVRVLGGGADWPTLHLRWTLSDGAGVLASAEDRLSDLGYLSGPQHGHSGSPLAYEQRLIERWFADRIGPLAAAAAR